MTEILAHAVLALHAALVLFNVFGPLWCWNRPRWRAAHLGTLALTLFFFATSGVCPLTTLEDRLRLRQDPAAAVAGGFIERWMQWLVYWDIPPGSVGAAAAAWFLLWTGVYAWLWRRRTRAHP